MALCIVCSLTTFYDSNSPVLKLMNWKRKWMLLNTKWLTILEFLIKKVHFKVRNDLFFTFFLIFSLDLPTYYGWKHDAKCSNISIRVRRPIYYCKVIVCTTKFIYPKVERKLSTLYLEQKMLALVTLGWNTFCSTVKLQSIAHLG